VTYVDLIEHYGTQKAAADAIGIKAPSVAEWKEKGIPLPRQAQYEIVTDGALTAERPTPQQAAA
jgi:hypothetical protein